jgi:uncharacterized Rmd1/YagE family protein
MFKTGNFERKSWMTASHGTHPRLLFKQIMGYLAAINNIVIAKLGLMDKNDLAWQYEKYDKLVDLLRDEFELEKRMGDLKSKISVVSDDVGRFVSFQQSEKSDFMEKSIIVLIAAEIVVMLFDISLTLSDRISHPVV